MNRPLVITKEQHRLLLARCAVFCPVSRYGRTVRVRGTARRNSDLDLVVFAAPERRERVYQLKEALDEGDLPFLVDFQVWDELPERFHEIISRERAVIQTQNAGLADALPESSVGVA